MATGEGGKIGFGNAAHRGFVVPQQRMSQQSLNEMAIRPLSPVTEIIHLFYMVGLIYF